MGTPQNPDTRIDILPFDIGRDRELYIEGELEVFRETLPGVSAIGPVAEHARSIVDDIPHAEHIAAFTALVADKPAGFVILSLQLFYEIPQCHLESIYVAPPYRRRGIAKTFIEIAQKWAATQSARSLLLDVSTANEAAIELFKSTGFVCTRLQMEKWTGS